MTDLEIIRLCALALHGGFNPVRLGNSEAGELVRYECQGEKFDPLHGDAQAMALVKKFGLGVDTYADKSWLVTGGWNSEEEVSNADLNRAICECVAKMQATKHD